MKILITGVGGFIGSNFADWLIKGGYKDVIGIDNLSGGYKSNIPKEVKFYNRNLEYDNIERLFKDVDIVYHMAAYAAEGLSPFMRKFNYRNNLVATANIINACINNNVKRLVNFSSMSVYGKQEYPFDEIQRPNPIDPYGVAKYACEMDIKIAYEQHGLEYCIIRPHNCYSEDTEILTNNGFKLFKDLEYGESVLTLNPITYEMEYHIPSAYQKYFYEGELINFKSKMLDICVTPDHNMVLKTDGYYDKIINVTAKEIIDSPEKYYYYVVMRSGYLFNGKKNTRFIIPEIKDSLDRSMNNNHQNGKEKNIDMLDWCEFLGWFISEGSMFKTPYNYVICISQCKNVHLNEYNKIKECIIKLGFNPYCTDKEIKIYSKQLYICLKNIFINYKDSHSKYIPREFLELDVIYLNKLYESLMLGDGTGNNKYSTCSKQLASNFQELCIKIGRSCNLHKEVKNSNGFYIFRLGAFNNSFPSLGDLKNKSINYNNIKYSGFVYDITVDNHIILTRRNGKLAWTSNCFGPKQNIWDRYRNVIGIWIYQYLHNQPLTIFGDGSQVRAFTYVKNIMEPVYNAGILSKAKGEIINLGGMIPTTINEILNILLRILDYDKVIHLESRHEVKYAYSTYQKSIDLLGYQEKYTIEDGLIEMVEWARQQKDRKRKSWDNYEINKKIYEFWRK